MTRDRPFQGFLRGKENPLSRQRGFTLVEMMTVVVIIGILAAIAIPALRNTADVESTARNLASIIGESARTAVARGPVPAEVVATSFAPERVRITISTAEPHVVTVQLQIETSSTTSQWFTVQETTLARGIRIAGASDIADLVGGTSTLTGGTRAVSPLVMGCGSTGQCDPRTIYVGRNDSTNDRYRVIVMPLSTAPQVLRNW